MRVAVLSLTRDRLDYTKHCFGRLRELAGCSFDHYVLDQGSHDGTSDWLRGTYRPFVQIDLDANIGVSRGINTLLRAAGEKPYDVVVKFDNDCELLVADTLRIAADLAVDGHWLASPHIQGLNEPPAVQREETVDGIRVGVPPLLGGIFLAAASSVYDRYRHADDNPIWGMDDVQLCGWFRNQGGELAYMLDYPANHYETTQGQRVRYPDYFERKDREFAA